MIKPSLPEKAETGVALIDALDTLHLQLDELVDSPSQYFRHLCDAIRVLLDAPLVAFLYPVAIDPVTNYHMYRTYGFPLPESGTPKNPAERIPSDGAIFTFEPYATRFHRSQFVKGYGRLHVNESEDGNAESPDWWPRTFATSIDKNNEHDTSEGSSTERTIPAESPAKLDTGSNDASGEFTKMFSQFAKSGTAYVAHYISPSFVQIPPEHLEDSMQNDPPNLPPQLGFIFCIFFPKEALKKFPEEAQEGRLLEVDWVLRLVDSWLRTAFADVFSHLGTEDDNPLSSANSDSEKVQAVGKTMKRTASDALEEQEDPSKQDSNDDGDAVIITIDDKSSSEVVTRANQQPTQKRARTHRASRHNHGTSTKHDHTHDSERHFSYMNRDNVFARFSHELRTPLQTIASVAQLMQTVLEVNATGSGQESKAEMARTSNIIEARAQLRVILAASEKITRMIDDLIDLIFWSTTGVPTVSVLEIRTISVKEMVEMAFSRVEESLNLGGFLAQDSIETEYNLASMTSEQKAKEPALENACPAMRLEIDDQLPEWIQVDRNKIMRVLKHLIRNACQAVGPKGEVVVRVFMEDNDDRPESNERNDTQGSLSSKSIIFSISDNGSGITNDACEQLFILNSDNGDPNHEGAGMGLVVCKGLVQSMSGDLWLEQTMPGKGSEFRVRIPLCLATSESTTTKQANIPSMDQASMNCNVADGESTGIPGTMDIDDKRIASNDLLEGDHSTRVTSATDDCRANTQCTAPAPAPVKRVHSVADLRVLVVEDNFVVRKLIVRMLGRLGMVNVVECENGLVAVQQCRKEHYDLVLMDCGMPVMDGFEASRQIREIYEVPRDSDSKEAHTEGSSSCQICKESQVRVTKLTTSTTNRTLNTLPRMRIVAVTANASYAHRQRVLQSGIDYCILKPVRFDDLHEVVRQLAVERDFIFKHTI